jgi:hypothetical protein
MAAYIGKIEAFDETIEPWSSYVERLGQYFKANKVDDSLKVASLLGLIGGKTYNPFTTNYILILTKYNYKHMMRKTV